MAQTADVYRALYLLEKFGTFQVGPRKLTPPGPGEIIVKVISAGLNPVDWKIQSHAVIEKEYPAILGSECAGEVEIVGEGVTEVQKGDKVLLQGGWKNSYAGFQEYVAVPAYAAIKVPNNITLDQAASLPVCVGTVTIALYSPAPSGLGFPAPWDGGRDRFAGKPALIIGGASSLGQYAIQFAKLSGFSPVLTTASLHNADLLKSLGATYVIDRNNPSSALPSLIADITTVPIHLVFDAISLEETQQLGYDTIEEGGYLVVVLAPTVKRVEGSRKNVSHVIGSLYMPGNQELAKALSKHLPGLIEAGEIIPNQVEVVPGGLNGVVSGLERLKKNLVSAKKLIVHPRETVTSGPPGPFLE